QILSLLNAEMSEDAFGQARWLASAISLANDRAKRAPPNPVAAPLVAEDVPPPAGPCSEPSSVAAVRDGSGARDDDDALAIANAGFERDERVVHDENPRARTDPPHDAVNDGRIVLAIDTCDAETHGRRR